MANNKEYTRLRLLQELVQTEKSYINDMQAFFDVYVRPIAGSPVTESSDVFTKLNLNTSTVITVAKQLLTEMLEADDAGEFGSKVGAVFKTWSNVFKAYKVSFGSALATKPRNRGM